MSCKTPVSTLQEMMVKKGCVVNYELIHDGGGTHINSFTYQVSCDGLVATGTGRCKKEAKHKAAQQMLETIGKHNNLPQLPASPAQTPIRTPIQPILPASTRFSQPPFINAIGSLQDLCSSHNLQDPEYIPISDVGPPHARIFTIQCVVSTFKEEGQATTKKQAKHEAAKKMLVRLWELVGSDDPSDLDWKSLQKNTDVMTDSLALARYPQLSKIFNTRKVNLGLKVSDYHLKLKNSTESTVRDTMIEKFKTFSNKSYDESKEIAVKMLKEDLQEFLDKLQLELKTYELSSCKDKIIAAAEINVNPPVMELSIKDSYEEAEFDAIQKAITRMVILLA